MALPTATSSPSRLVAPCTCFLWQLVEQERKRSSVLPKSFRQPRTVLRPRRRRRHGLGLLLLLRLPVGGRGARPVGVDLPALADHALARAELGAARRGVHGAAARPPAPPRGLPDADAAVDGAGGGRGGAAVGRRGDERAGAPAAASVARREVAVARAAVARARGVLGVLRGGRTRSRLHPVRHLQKWGFMCRLKLM